ncbi:DUF2945 domain-containing protein [Streptomyces sp. NPDC046161]|uniref:DUF2945 domain-containing protein n=1 Tax=Streptomyces sp. NPDC046161 TaxID=3155132 RepID=UPI0033C3D5A2
MKGITADGADRGTTPVGPGRFTCTAPRVPAGRNRGRPTKAAGRTVDASKDEPQYEVESAKSGRRAVHKPQSLRRRDDDT